MLVIKRAFAYIREFIEKFNDMFNGGSILTAVIVAVICIVAIKIIMKMFSKIIAKTPLDNTLNSFIKSAFKIVLYIVAVLIVADSLGIPITSLLALFSVVGLAVSLAVQGSLANLAGGVTVLATKPFGNGDFVEIGGQSGTVKEIGLIYTKLNTADNKLIYVPNSEVSSSKIVNYTAENKRRVDIVVDASYSSPINEVKAALEKAVAKTEYVLKDQDIIIVVNEYKSSAISYAVKVWAATDDYWNALGALNENIKYAFDEAGVEMTYDHMNVHILNK